MSSWKTHALGIWAGVAILAGLAWAETLEMVTYYPAPSAAGGSFDRLHANRATIGDAYNRTNVPDAQVPDGQLFVFDRLGIGTTTPISALHVVSTAGDAANDITLDFHSNVGNAGGEVATRRSRGTPAAPTSVADDDDLGGVTFTGFNGTAFLPGAVINPTVDGTPNAGGVPTSVTIETYNGTSLSPRLHVTAGGNVGIGTTTPRTPAPNGQAAGNLDVNDVYLRSTGQWASQGGGTRLVGAVGPLGGFRARNGNETALGSIGGNFTGRPVLILVNLYASGASSGHQTFDIRVRLDGTGTNGQQVFVTSATTPHHHMAELVAVSIVHVPPAGAHTYFLTLQSRSSLEIDGQFQQMAVIEL